MKTAKRILTVALALMLIFAMAAPSFALSSTAGSYIQSGTITENGEFVVTLSIQSDKVNSTGPISRLYYTVEMGTDGISKAYTVSDVLNAAQTQYDWLTFYSSSNTPLHVDYFVYGVNDSDVSTTEMFTPVNVSLNGSTAYCGWMFRVNGMIPMASDGITGLLMNQTYIKGGDHIDLYYASIDADSATVSTVLEAVAQSGNTVYFIVYGSSVTDEGVNGWDVSNYSFYANKSIQYKFDGTTYTTTTNQYGIFSVNNVTAGTHTIELVPTYNSGTKNGNTYYVPKYTGTAFAFQK
ncbi:MAG: hypothetical protein IKR48_13600 [Kiritimatiellae bacterium]|nr:hypothetical protein [Kiritimatiellia bacterium]